MVLRIHSSQSRFDQFYKEIDDLYHDVCLRLGLSDGVFQVLYGLCELGDGCLQRDICERSFLSKQTVHSAVRKLKTAGLLRLTAGRGRDMHLSLTEAGRTLARKTAAPVSEAEYRAMEALSPDERKTLILLTEKYVVSLRRELAEVR